MINLLNRLKDELTKWKEVIGLKTCNTLEENIARSESFDIDDFLVCCGYVQLQVNLVKRQCSYLSWDKTGIPCKHACVAIPFTRISYTL